MKTIDEYRIAVESAISGLDLHRQPDGLYAPIRYALEEGGKRLRPVLALAAAEALGGDTETTMPAAVAIEVFHNFTLLHDDIMDKSPTRRGRPSVYRKWNEATAILSGDAMLTFATELLARCQADRVGALLTAFNRAAMAVYEGQQYDMDFESRDDVTVAEYMSMIDGKTSALLVGAVSLGVICAGGNARQLDAFGEYARNLGLAFQLEDDLLDSFGDAATFGKPIGGDILNDKKTWLLITARAEDKVGALKAVMEAGLSGQEKIDSIKEIYRSLGLPSRCESLIKELTEKAVASLKGIGLDEDAVKFFTDLANGLVGRKK